MIKNRKGKQIHFSWVTDILVTKENILTLAKRARSRWKIENETFNTLKNQGYEFEHNYGHGYKHLSHVFGLLMFLAFLVDQVQQRCCGLFQAALEKCQKKVSLWKRLHFAFLDCYIDSWSDLFHWVCFRRKPNLKEMLDNS